MKFIHTLRKKPDSFKRSFAFFVSGGVTALVFGMWAISMLVSSTTPSDSADNLAEDGSAKSFSPFSVISNQFGSIFSEFKQQVAGVGFLNESTTTNQATIPTATPIESPTEEDSRNNKEMSGEISATSSQYEAEARGTSTNVNASTSQVVR